MSKKLNMVKNSMRKGWEIFTICSIPFFAVSSMAGMGIMMYGKTDKEQFADVERFVKTCPIAVLVICGIGLGMLIFV